MNSNSVACPLDCFDTCEAVYDNGKCKPSREHYITNGKLCKNFAYLLGEERLEQPSFENKELSLQEALDVLTQKLQQTDPSKVLYYKGSGNLGVMQSTPKNFFANYNATMTRGSLCDGIGAAGLEKARDGHNLNPSIDKLLDAEVVIVWGRNLTVTSSHMYDLIKDKTFITIDPIQTPIAKKSEIHLQINPKSDHDLALLMTRFAYMNDMEEKEHFEEYSSGDDWFFDLAKSKPLVSYEATTGVSLGEVSDAMDLLKGKKVAILLGLGVQKYYEGAQITHAIDSFANYIGVHNKKAGGVWYLQDSSYGYDKPYSTKSTAKKVNIAEVDFSNYEVVFIQGANPLVSTPNTKFVKERLEKTFVVYFGTTHNDTADYANLIIPSSNFLAKKDVRLSYGHEFKAISNAVEMPHKNTISEYALTQYLNQAFGYEQLPNEEDIIAYYVNHTLEMKREIESFEFIEELEVDELYEKRQDNEYFFITCKQSDCLNSQFKVDNAVHLHPNLGYVQGQEVILTSEFGTALFVVNLNDTVKENSVMVYAGAKNGNYVTPSASDEEAYSAIFQEVLVRIELP